MVIVMQAELGLEGERFDFVDDDANELKESDKNGDRSR